MTDFARDRFEAVFRAEAHELIGRLEKGIVALARGEGDDALLDRMLRAAHTLRGSSKMMGYAGAAAAARLMEESIEGARGGTTVPGDALVAALRECIGRVLQALDRGE